MKPEKHAKALEAMLGYVPPPNTLRHFLLSSSGSGLVKITFFTQKIVFQKAGTLKQMYVKS